VFGALRKLRAEGRQFDFVVLDPPKFAPTPKDAERAARGYKDINLNALKVLRRGGLLATFSCSGGVSPELFQKILAGRRRRRRRVAPSSRALPRRAGPPGAHRVSGRRVPERAAAGTALGACSRPDAVAAMDMGCFVMPGVL